MKTLKNLREFDFSYIFYDPITGLFSRFHKQRNKIVNINPTPTKNGYLRAKINHQLFMLHDIAYFIMTGENPVEIDHINRNPSDNKWENLRNCTRNTNCSNRNISKNGTVFSDNGKRIRKWKTSIRAFGKSYFLGCFFTKEEGENAYIKSLYFVENNMQEKLEEYVFQLKLEHKKQSKINYSNAIKCIWEKRKLIDKIRTRP